MIGIGTNFIAFFIQDIFGGTGVPIVLKGKIVAVILIRLFITKKQLNCTICPSIITNISQSLNNGVHIIW